jgi:transposase
MPRKTARQAACARQSREGNGTFGNKQKRATERRLRPKSGRLESDTIPVFHAFYGWDSSDGESETDEEDGEDEDAFGIWDELSEEELKQLDFERLEQEVNDELVCALQWQETAARQILEFERPGESSRCIRRHSDNAKLLKRAGNANGSSLFDFYQKVSSSSSSSFSASAFCPECSSDVDDSFSGERLHSEQLDEDDPTILKQAYEKIKSTPEASIPLSSRANKKLSELTKYEHVQYLCIKSFLHRRVYGLGKMAASIEVASVFFQASAQKDSYRAFAIREWASHYLRVGKLREFRRGKHVKTFTVITNEAVQQKLIAKIRNMKDIERSPENVKKKLDDEWLAGIQNAPDRVSVNTARRWMRFLGFAPGEHKKGYFVDGHEREDVIQHRIEFLQAMQIYEGRMLVWGGADMNEHLIVLPEGIKPVVFIVQDESIFYTNDAVKMGWLVLGEIMLRPKSNGRSLHVSGFMCACHGFMRIGNRRSYKIIKPGKNADGYWTNADLVKQLEEEVISLAEELHPGCDLVFAFDNSSNHHARNPTALCANNLNLNDGGKHIKPLRNTVWNGAPQQMQTSEGVQKGIRSILQERGLWQNGMLLEDARAVLAQCPDFAGSKCWLQEMVESRGHKHIFFPKFHCELNFIEMIWAHVKADLRRDCSFNFNDLQEKLPRLLDNISLPFVKRVARHCYRFMDGYRKGLVGPVLDYAMRKYKGHRMIPAESLQLVKDEFDRLQQEQAAKNRKSS